MWIQNVAEPRRNDHIGKFLKLGEPCFHAVMAAILNVIVVLERFCHIVTETEIATKTAFFESLSVTVFSFMVETGK